MKKRGLNLTKEDIEAINKDFEKADKLKEQYNLTDVEAMNIVDGKKTLEETLAMKNKNGCFDVHKWPA